jgi:glycerol-3-phosphate dehydrogenase
MPICEAIDAILSNRVSVDEAILSLLMRPFRAEGR